MTFDLEALGKQEHKSLEEVASSAQLLLLYLENDALLVQEGALLGLLELIYSSSAMTNRMDTLNQIHTAVSAWASSTQSAGVKGIAGEVLQLASQAMIESKELN